MKNIKRIFFHVTLCLLHSSQMLGEDISAVKGSNNVLVQVINVRSRHDNKWMEAVNNSKNSSGWDINIKQTIPQDESLRDIFVHFYTRDTPKSFQENLFESDLCNLLTNYPNSQFFPKDIVDMILPGSGGSCEIKKGKHPIKSTGCLNTEYQQNPGVIFPVSKSYELIVDFLSKSLPDDQRFFRVNFIVGNTTGCTYGQNNEEKGKGQSQNKCTMAPWIARPLCKISQKVTSGISALF